MNRKTEKLLEVAASKAVKSLNLLKSIRLTGGNSEFPQAELIKGAVTRSKKRLKLLIESLLSHDYIMKWDKSPSYIIENENDIFNALNNSFT